MKGKLIVAIGLGALAFNVSASAADNAGQASAKLAKETSNPAATSTPTTANSTYTTDADKLSYTIGVDIGENFKAQSLQINPEVLAKGVKDALSGQKLAMSKEEMQQTIMQLQNKILKEQEQKMKEVGDKNSKQGTEYLENNKKQKGVIVLPSGLQYRVVEEGKGPLPKADDTVTVDYEGKLINGEVFDSSYQRGKSVDFKVSQVIPGMQEALQKMPVGSTWELVIPANLAYGDRGLGGPIGPNETLLFKLHLVGIGGSNDAATDKNKAASTEQKS